jgi:uncharacterized protein (TIGR02145 family)
LKKNIDQYVDTLGNSIQIGLTSNLPQFVDSVSIKICSETYIVEQGTFLKNINPSDKDPTWFSTRLDKVGLKYIIAQALIQDNFTYSDTITIVVVPRPVDTIPDAQGPIITKESGLATGARTANPNDTLVYTVTDVNGVDTVSWTLNGTPYGVLAAGSNGRYSINAVLTRYHLDTIVITASDKSPNRNKSADTTILDYNVAPKANDQNLSTKKNTTLSITLTADPIDGDSLSGWTVVTPPANGILSGTAPNLTYTPQTGFLGSDSLTFTVSDGKNAGNVAKIKINVSDVLVAPIAGKTIADISVIKGALASFAASVNADVNPSPTFSWVKEGDATPISTSQTYTINQTIYSDQARYRCIISNSQGTDSSNWVTLTVKDVTAPVITLTGANPQQIQFNGTYTELGATASDDKDGNLSSSIKIDATSVKTNIAGSYTVTYDVQDAAGNAATQIKRTVTVAPKPTYTLTVSVGSGGGGIVAPSGTVTVNQGDATPLTATPSAATGYMFDKWAVTTGAATLANPTSATAATVMLSSGDATVTASFKLIPCQLTVDAGTHGTLTAPASGSVVTVNYGVATDIAVTPGLGYSFTKWTTTDATVTFANANNAATKVTLTGAGKVAATYTLNQCTVNFIINGVSFSQVTVTAGNSVGAANMPAAPTPPNDSDFASWQTPDNSAFDGTTVVWTSVNVTPKYKAILDADNNAYHTVTIGSYTWIKENLRTTQYWGGASIGTANLSWYNNSPSITYGALYSWAAASNSNIAPKGWHVATSAEWDDLTFNVGGENTGGSLMAMNAGWVSYDNPALPSDLPTNSSNFTAYPNGFYANTGNPSGIVYWDATVAAYWWYKINDAMKLDNAGNISYVDPTPTGAKYSIRCVRDHP